MNVKYYNFFILHQVKSADCQSFLYFAPRQIWNCLHCESQKCKCPYFATCKSRKFSNIMLFILSIMQKMEFVSTTNAKYRKFHILNKAKSRNFQISRFLHGTPFLYLHDVKTGTETGTGTDELESGMITNFYITKSSV